MLNGLMILFCQLLDWILNPLIILLGIGEIVLAVMAGRNLGEIRRKLNMISGEPERSVRSIKKNGHTVVKASVFLNGMDWEEYDGLCREYQDKGRWYSIFSTTIQIFPLLGILGTVAGLFLALNTGEGISNAADMFEGIRFALSSTVLGISAAAIFKVVDVVFISVYVNYIEDGLSRFQSNYKEAKEDAS